MWGLCNNRGNGVKIQRTVEKRRQGAHRRKGGKKDAARAKNGDGGVENVRPSQRREREKLQNRFQGVLLRVSIDAYRSVGINWTVGGPGQRVLSKALMYSGGKKIGIARMKRGEKRWRQEGKMVG